MNLFIHGAEAYLPIIAFYFQRKKNQDELRRLKTQSAKDVDGLEKKKIQNNMNLLKQRKEKGGAKERERWRKRK